MAGGDVDPAGQLAAQAGIAVFATAFERWASLPVSSNFRELSADVVGHLRAAARAGHGYEGAGASASESEIPAGSDVSANETGLPHP
ncbi:MAG TPA: hypothetical protein VMA32_16770 [Streptosporangiaceae bacterium]|nr:hypothetical protein [Streptosporangiaceae bacterium]